MSKEKVLAIVGAGEAAVPIILKAKEIGITSVAFGEANSLAKDKADIFVEMSIFDIDGMEKACLQHSINGVIASSEITTESAAVLANRLCLPGNRCEPVFLCRNKYLMREAVKNAKNVKQPGYYLYNGEDIESFPVMVKAVDSCGKKGISLVRNKDELAKALDNSRNISTDNTVLIEEFINGGREISVECLACANNKYIIQITDKVTSGPPHFTEIAHHQPAGLEAGLRQRVEKAAEEILSLLGVEYGMAHLEMKVFCDNLYFIEIGARAGGDHIGDTLVGLSTDYDYYKGAIECSFGKLDAPAVCDTAYSGIIFHCPENKCYSDLFDVAGNSDWCVVNNVKTKEFRKAECNTETAESGYLIYRSDHRLSQNDAKKNKYYAEVINSRTDAFDLIWKHNKEIGRSLSDEELERGIHKFIDHGNVISIIENNRIIAFLMLYCNNYETLEAYICNVYVLKPYRGVGLSKLLMDKAIDICVANKFETIKLHVAEDNYNAVGLYKAYAFEADGNIKDDGERLIEMIKRL